MPALIDDKGTGGLLLNLVIRLGQRLVHLLLKDEVAILFGKVLSPGILLLVLHESQHICLDLAYVAVTRYTLLDLGTILLAVRRVQAFYLACLHAYGPASIHAINQACFGKRK